MNKIERVQTVLSGGKPDRPPLGFWHHFTALERSGEAAVAAHLTLFERYDLDFLKVMNDHDFPRLEGVCVERCADLKYLERLTGQERQFVDQLEVIAALKERLRGEALMCTTIFSPWAVLRRLTVPASDRHGPPSLTFAGDLRDKRLVALLAEDREAVAVALSLIARVLGRFAELCIQAGADGIFLSVRDDWVDIPHGAGTYAALARSADFLVLEGAQTGTFNILHVCGRALAFGSFAEYPVQVLSWADRYAGPTIKAVAPWLKPAICAGVDNLHTLTYGTSRECQAEVWDALAQAGERPMIVAPGCTFDPEKVPIENLEALCRAVRIPV